MTLDEIKEAVDGGAVVCWKNPIYRVVHDKLDRWLIVCTLNDYTTHLSPDHDLQDCFVDH